MKLLLSTESGLIHKAIRIASFSQWSHIAVIDGDSVIEATYTAGVRQIPLQQAIEQTTKHAFLDIPIADELCFMHLVRSQIGKPYDYTAILGFLAHRDWQSEDRWFCAELPAWAAALSGNPIFRPEAMHRVTPEHWWMLAERKTV